MDEYAVTSEMIRDFRDARDRTADWVSELQATKLYSPSLPRSELGDEDSDKNDSQDISDAESSHSVPPRLMHRYDGRPGMPIQDPGYNAFVNPMSRSQTMPQHYPPPGAYEGNMLPQSPEQIKILPSRSINNPSSHHTRSKSLPRDGLSLAGPQEQYTPLPARIATGSPYHQQYQNRPALPYSQSHPAPGYGDYGSQGVQSHRHKSHGHQSRHAHPGAYMYPPPVGPNGIIYSHSDPIPNSYYPSMASPQYHPAVEERRGRDHHHRRHHSTNPAVAQGRQDYGRERRGRSRSRSMGPEPRRDSTSTYYILQNGSTHKVHTRNPGLTHSSTSYSTRSPTTPLSPGFKRPFFQRILHFADWFSSSQVKVAAPHGMHGPHPNLRRRHSTDRL